MKTTSRRWIRPGLLWLCVAVASGGCFASAGAGGEPDGSTDTAAATEREPDSGVQPAANPNASTAARFRIPPGHLPPPGQCRVWMPDEPPGQQKGRSAGRCSELRETIPAGAWLVYRPTDDAKVIRVWQYGEERQVLSQRIYDAVTGELLRHVAPLGS